MDEQTLRDYPLFRSIIHQHKGLPSHVQKTKKCFVISPIGAPDSVHRRHADQVMDFIIRPALLDTMFDPYRADHTEAPGRISQQMFDAILDDDMLVAIMTFHNPNVFYEIAVAQSAARPLVLLIEEGHDIPFDVKDDRVITYSLNTDKLVDGMAAEKLRTAIETLSASQPRKGPPFRPEATPLNSGLGDTLIHERSTDLPYSTRVQMFQTSENSVDLVSIANLALGRHPDVLTIATTRKDRPLVIRLLQVSPDNPGLPSLLGTDEPNYLKNVGSEIEAAAVAWQKAAGSSEGGFKLEIRRLTRFVPNSSIMIADELAIWTPYLASHTTGHSPTGEARKGTAVYEVARKEFEHLWRNSEPYRPQTTPYRNETPQDRAISHPSPSKAPPQADPRGRSVEQG